MTRLIALDMDNTLLNEDMTIDPRTIEYLRKCHEMGIEIVLASGRRFTSMRRYADNICPGVRILCFNGAKIMSTDGETFFSKSLDTDIMNSIVDFSRENDLRCQFYTDRNIILEDFSKLKYINPDMDRNEVLEVGDFKNYDMQPSPKALIYCDPWDVPKMQAKLAEKIGDRVYIAQSQPYLIEVTAAGVNKALSLDRLCAEIGIERANTMAFGDNTNDKEMLEWSGFGVAVANSVEVVKEIADYVTEAERSAGVAEALERFVLQKLKWNSEMNLI